MFFTIPRENLINSLQLVAASSAAGGSSILPILKNLLLSVQGNLLTLTATDCEIEMSCTLALEGKTEDGAITVPARKLVSICKGLETNSQIEIHHDAKKDLVFMRSNRSRYKLSSLPAIEYPNTGEFQILSEAKIAQDAFKAAVESTAYAMANQDVRYYLNGLLLEIKDQVLTNVATDGHRLSLCKTALNEATQDQSIIIPRKAVSEMTKLLGNDPTPIVIKFGSSHIRILANGFTFTSKLIDGRFPDYNRVIPRNNNLKMTCDRDMLKQALTRAAILSNEKFKGVRLKLSTGVLNITATNPSQEQAEEYVDIDYQGPDLEIGFNIGYILDALNSLKNEKITIYLFNSNTSAILNGAGNNDKFAILMPMKL